MRPAHLKRRSGWNCLGFSLLELLLVVAILVLLTTIYWSPGAGSRQRALAVACQHNLQKLSIGLLIYSKDNEGRFPLLSNAARSEQAFQLLAPRYSSDTSVLICPASKDSVPAPGTSLTNSRVSYAYYMGRGTANPQDVVVTDAQVNSEAKAAGELLFSADGKAPGNNHEKAGGNLLYADGHVTASPPRASLALPLRPGERLLNP